MRTRPNGFGWLGEILMIVVGQTHRSVCRLIRETASFPIRLDFLRPLPLQSNYGGFPSSSHYPQPRSHAPRESANSYDTAEFCISTIIRLGSHVDLSLVLTTIAFTIMAL